MSTISPDEAGSVLVTGSSGAIGTALANRLLERDHDVVCVDRRPNRWSPAVDEVTELAELPTDSLSSIAGEPDVIYHLAATSSVGTTIEDPSRAVDNVATTQSVLEFARETGAGVVYASSREVYGTPASIPCAEGGVDVEASSNPYAASKIGGEALCRAYETCYDIDVVRLRFSNVYGRYDDNRRVVPLFVSQATVGDELEVFGGQKVLDFVYVDDAVSAATGVLESFRAYAGEAYNVGSGEATPLTSLARMVSGRIPECPGYAVRENRTGEVPRFTSDITKARQVLGYEPGVGMSEGLGRTIEWYQSRPEVVSELTSG